jgi:hypothetical protein
MCAAGHRRAVKKLAPAFAFLSTANPSSLSSMERAAGYAVPLLQSGLDIDPMEELRRQGDSGVVPEPRAAAPKAMLAPISLSLNVDGTTLARVMSQISANSFSGQAPVFDGLDAWVGGDHNYPDK